ncbi:hypothetical protein CL656_03385 [bacterium]|nr:hypothetical protein [bacterium]|tara:strand:+ start:6500 stop:6829 length:330 start_codon:yes stop_codon:yes gene_type:complete
MSIKDIRKRKRQNAAVKKLRNNQTLYNILNDLPLNDDIISIIRSYTGEKENIKRKMDSSILLIKLKKLKKNDDELIKPDKFQLCRGKCGKNIYGNYCNSCHHKLWFELG